MASYDSDKVAHIHEELHSHLPPEPALRVKALESLLVEKGVLKTDAVDTWLDNLAEKIGPKNGARVIAKSWVDPRFRRHTSPRCHGGFYGPWSSERWRLWIEGCVQQRHSAQSDCVHLVLLLPARADRDVAKLVQVK